MKKKKNNQELYFSISRVFAAIKTARRKRKKFIRMPGTRAINISLALRTFKRSVKCAGCGLEGRYFKYNRSQGLRLVGVVNGERERYFSSDHIVPKSKGGSGNLLNRQTMCDTCNSLKGNQTPRNYYEKATYCLSDFRDALRRYKDHIFYKKALIDLISIQEFLERQRGEGEQYLSFFQAVSLASYFQFTWSIPVSLEHLGKYPETLQKSKEAAAKMETPWYIQAPNYF